MKNLGLPVPLYYYNVIIVHPVRTSKTDMQQPCKQFVHISTPFLLTQRVQCFRNFLSPRGLSSLAPRC